MGTSLLLACIGLLSFVGQLVCDQYQQQQQHQQQQQQKQQQQLLLSSAAKEFVEKLYEYDSLRPKIVYSPYSIHRALTMTSLGARGLNAEEMKEVLCITSLGDSVHSLYRELTQEVLLPLGMK
uniref:Serpin domain-containing protein n=1 Tax=Biomphalaria glabrata TaxID=6526 RepID=A0A2C9KAL9_BIOGL